MKIDDPTFLQNATFQEISALEPDEQRQLLESDTPRMRIWAAWAMGLRLYEGASSPVREALATEPVAGVRRHLLVMLAGFGEVDIVAALARHDPDNDVRKTAARFVGELAVKHRDAYAIAAQLLADPRPETRAAIIDGLAAEVPANIRALLERAHDDVSTEVREALGRRDAALADIDTLRATASAERNMVVRRHALRALFRQIGISETLGAMSAGQRKRALEDIKALGMTLSFEDIEALQPGPAFLEFVRVDDLGARGRRWLLSLIDLPTRNYWQLVDAAYDSVTTIESAEERSAVIDFVDRVEASLLAVEPLADVKPGAVTPWGDWSPFEASRRTLIDAMRRRLQS